MRFTNIHNLPSVLERILTYDNYDLNKYEEGVISVTELIGPPQISILRREFHKSIEEDVSGRIFMTLGNAFHNYAEMILGETDIGAGKLVEHRISHDAFGLCLKGKPDYVEEGVLYDFKTTSVWNSIRGANPEWEKQLNCYAYIVQKELGIHIRSLMVLPIFRDWMPSQAKRSSDYPRVPSDSFNIPLWDQNTAEDYIRERVFEHIEARETYASSGTLPLCSKKERWATDDKWAVMKRGRKSALKLMDSEEAAVVFIENHKWKSDLYIDMRAGESRRCMEYCNVSGVCDQYGASCLDALGTSDLPRNTQEVV